MEGKVGRYFFLVVCVFILYHDVCSTALTLHKRRGFYNPRGRHRPKFGNKPQRPDGQRWRNYNPTGRSGQYFGAHRHPWPEGNRGSHNLPWPGGDKGLNNLPWNEGSLTPNPEFPTWNETGDILSNGEFIEVLHHDERLHFNTFIGKIAKGAYINEKGFEKILVENEKHCDHKYLEHLQNEGFNVTNERDICADWQDFDGTTCVCSNQCTNNSDINMGMVCDSDGHTFPHLCDFTYKMCSAQILCSATLASCGVCNALKLTGSHIYPEHGIKGLGIFLRDPGGNTWTATDDHGKQIRLFYSDESKSWVIGSTDLTQAGIVFKTYTPNPQDSHEGAVVYVNETYGQLDPFLHLECLSDSTSIAKRETNVVLREKRFAFLIAMAIISVVATVAQVTVTAVQHKRGCLFYPEVCKMKKEIKNSLRPEVESLKRTYVSIIGEPVGFKTMVQNFFKQLLDLKEKMIELRKLESEFRDLSKTIGPDLKYLSPEFSNDFDTSFHDNWLKALGTQTAWGIFGLVYVQMPLEIISLVASTASKAAMAFAAFGAVISVAAAVTAIIVSWKNEKSQRDQLRKVKRNLIDARQRLKTALSHAKGFQVKFYKTVIYPLKKFTSHMRTYDPHFQNFYVYLISMFGSTMSPNVGANIYGKIKRNSIKTMQHNHLTPLLHFLSFKLNDLKKKIESYRQTEKLITLIRKNLNEQIFPKEILSLVKRVDKKIATKLVPTEFSLLKFTAERVLSKTECYWGYHLTGIRKGEVTSSNYKSVPLCNSPELSAIEATFQSLTGQNMAPDRIVNRIQHKRFTNTYQKLKFLADFILPAKPCYWGYDLSLIRKNKLSESEIVKAKPSQAAFSSIKPLPDNLKANALCSAIKICDKKWQTYVKCLLKTFDGGNLCKGAANC